jgi:hypothetical protein
LIKFLFEKINKILSITPKKNIQSYKKLIFLQINDNKDVTRREILVRYYIDELVNN